MALCNEPIKQHVKRPMLLLQATCLVRLGNLKVTTTSGKEGKRQQKLSRNQDGVHNTKTLTFPSCHRMGFVSGLHFWKVFVFLSVWQTWKVGTEVSGERSQSLGLTRADKTSNQEINTQMPFSARRDTKVSLEVSGLTVLGSKFDCKWEGEP